ncbi:hypothetical protein K458DRAFT_291797 [Lentithecium fluviatile CBS 122367]|uniref:Rhodopsin domain-containing protein n=1 Tax=Lentithecium fluviatile CBS 122367 TaxID=1168545 RepID=A0A6G1JFZ8_9PLEO|nr:hypothetical protein K458DRAFT_291797 [Lentithecium fluviatile CBS 122367]
MDSAGNVVNAVVLVFTLLSGLTLFLRLFMRGVLVRKAGFEDGWIMLAMTFSIGHTVAIAIQVQNGLGAHIWQLNSEQKTTSQKAFWASIWLYNVALTTTKISILFQYLRIFSGRRFRIACFVMLAIVAIWGTWTLFGSIFLCSPVDFFWDKSIARGTCLDQAKVWFVNAGVNIAQDVAILFMPLPMIRGLDIPVRLKKVLLVVFALGGFVCLSSIIRLQSLVRIANSPDPTYDNPNAAMFSAIEVNIGILCACLPSLRPLLSAMLPSYFRSTAPYMNVETRDEERPKHTRYPTVSSVTFVPGMAKRSYHSRTGSNSSQAYTPRYGHSRTGSQGSSRSNLGIENELDVLSSSGRGSNGPVRNSPRVSAHPGHQLHPLRMSPFSPVIPRLPRLPEHIAAFGPLSPAFRSSRHSRHQRRASRTPVFQKPLPITPFPIMPGT